MAKNLKKRRGMAATEYVIGLILVAVGSIGIFSAFGNQIKAKISQVSAALSGDSGKYTTAVGNSGTKAEEAATRAAKKNSMKGAENTDMDME